MPKQYLFRALRCAAIALFLATGLEVFEQAFFPNLSAWQLHITAILLCASIVFLLTFRLLCREQVHSSCSTVDTNFPANTVGSLTTGSLSDVAKRKATEDKLLALASIVECSQDAIIGKTSEGVITNWNQAAEKMYGYTSAEAIGRDLCFLVPPERQGEVQAIMERIRTGKPVQNLETQRVTKVGCVLDVSLSISPIKDGSGRITGASTIARDITLA